MKLGVAAFVGEFASGVTTINYLLLALVGNVAVAAYGVIANLALVGVAIFNGISGDGRHMHDRDFGRFITYEKTGYFIKS